MKCEADTALAWSVLAENSLSNLNVFFLESTGDQLQP